MSQVIVLYLHCWHEKPIKKYKVYLHVLFFENMNTVILRENKQGTELNMDDNFLLICVQNDCGR